MVYLMFVKQQLGYILMLILAGFFLYILYLSASNKQLFDMSKPTSTVTIELKGVLSVDIHGNIVHQEDD